MNDMAGHRVQMWDYELKHTGYLPDIPLRAIMYNPTPSSSEHAYPQFPFSSLSLPSSITGRQVKLYLHKSSAKVSLLPKG